MCERNNDQACCVDDEPRVLRHYALWRATLGRSSLAQQHLRRYCASVDNFSPINKGKVEEQTFATPHPRCQESPFNCLGMRIDYLALVEMKDRKSSLSLKVT